MKAATKTKSGDKSQNGQLITVTLNKALSAEAEWDDKVSYTVLLPLALSGLRESVI